MQIIVILDLVLNAWFGGFFGFYFFEKEGSQAAASLANEPAVPIPGDQEIWSHSSVCLDTVPSLGCFTSGGVIL